MKNVTTFAQLATGGVAIHAHPLVSVVDLTLASGGSASVGTSGMNIYAANLWVHNFCTNAQLNSVVTRYRVVYLDTVLKIQTPELTRTGKIIIAPFVETRTMPGTLALNATAMQVNSIAMQTMMGGMSQAIAFSSAILNMPGAKEYIANELGTKKIRIRCKPVSSNVQNFHSSINATTNDYSATASFGQNVTVVSATGVVSNADVDDVIDISGWSGAIIYWEGFPAATPTFEMCQELGIEGTPTVSSSTTGTGAGISPIPAPTPVIKSRSTMDTILEKVANINFVDLIGDTMNAYEQFQGYHQVPRLR